MNSFFFKVPEKEREREKEGGGEGGVQYIVQQWETVQWSYGIEELGKNKVLCRLENYLSLFIPHHCTFIYKFIYKTELSAVEHLNQNVFQLVLKP